MNKSESSFKQLFIPFTTAKAITFLIIFGLVIYANSLFNGFVVDDKTYIISNPEFHSFDLGRIFGQNIFNSNVTGQYHPIPALYFSLLYSIFGDIAFFYHLPQLILHITNSILVFFLFKKFLRKELSAFLSVIFLIHPLQTESVVYIAASGDPLFFLFGMTAMLLSFKDQFSLNRLLMIGLLFTLSVLTKETGVLFIFATLLYTFLFKKAQVFKVGLVGLSAILIYIGMRFLAGVTSLAFKQAPIANATFTERLMHIPAIFSYYFYSFIYPINLATNQFWVINDFGFENFLIPLSLFFILIFSFIGFLFYLTKRDKNYLLPFLLFLAFLSLGFGMHSQVYPLDFTVADRFFYFPMLGLLGVLGIILTIIFKRFKLQPSVILVLGAVVICILGIRTMVRNSNWYDTLTLLNHDRQIQNNYSTENNLGTEYALIKNYPESLKHYHNSINLKELDSTYYNIGLVYERMGDPEQAKNFYYKALNTSPSPPTYKHDIGLYKTLGKLLFFQNKNEDARIVLHQGTNDYPNDAGLWTLVAVNEQRLNNQSDALTAAAKAKQLKPGEQTDVLYSNIQNNIPVKVNP